MVPTSDDVKLAVLLERACESAGVRFIKIDYRKANLGVTPALAIAMQLRKDLKP